MSGLVQSLDGFKEIVYVGDSMYPLFRNLDVLYVDTYKDISIGDIIVFKLQDQSNDIIVHRVISIEKSGVITKGDNNKRPDPGFRTPEYLMGKVFFLKRGKRISRVYGGSRGIIFSTIYSHFLSVKTSLLNILYWPYSKLSHSGICRALLPGFIKYRVITVKRSEGNEFLLVTGRYVIGKFVPAAGNWKIRPPFKLFIDDKSLPKPQKK